MYYDVEAAQWSGGPGRKGLKRFRWLPYPGSVALASSLAKTAWSVAKSRYANRSVPDIKLNSKRKLDYQPEVAVAVEEEEKGGVMDQSGGLRRSVHRKVYRKVSRFNINKLNNSDNSYQCQQLGLRLRPDPRTLKQKHLVSEFNPTQGGKICIANMSSASQTPMHIYDLNFLCTYDTSDSRAYYPIYAAAGRNTDVNARAWVWDNSNVWSPDLYTFGASGTPVRLGDYSAGGGVGTGDEPRYYIDNPRGAPAPYSYNTEKVFRKGIDIKFIAYGCRKMPTEMEFRVIKISDPDMCPDNPDSYSTPDHLELFKQNWQNLIRAWTQNPVLKGVEPGPKAVKKWFKTVAVKRVRLGEQTGAIDSIPCIQSGIKVDLNQLIRYSWDTNNFTLETGQAAYDNIPQVEDANNNTNFNKHGRPYYTSRYYLLVRALSCVDASAGGEDVDEMGADLGQDWNYTPSYDLVIKNKFIVKTGHNY